MVINARHAPCTFGQQNSHMCNIKLVQFLCFSCRFFPPQERHRICNSFFLDLPSSSSHVGAFYCQNVDKKGAWCVFKSEKRCLVDKSFPQSIGVIYIYIYIIYFLFTTYYMNNLSESNTKAGMVKDVTLGSAFAMTLFCAFLLLLSL